MVKIIDGINGYKYHLDSKGKVVKLTNQEQFFYGMKYRPVNYIPCEYTRYGLEDVSGKYTPKQLTERMYARKVVPYHPYGRLGFGRVDDHAAEGLGFDYFDYILDKKGNVISVIDNSGVKKYPYQKTNNSPNGGVNVSGKYYPSALMNRYYRREIYFK